MNSRFRSVKLLPLALGLALAACGDKDEQMTGDASASGEVLEGTISDDMLPLDEVRSTAPIATPKPTATATGPAEPGKDAADSEDASDESAAEDATPEAPAPAESE